MWERLTLAALMTVGVASTDTDVMDPTTTAAATEATTAYASTNAASDPAGSAATTSTNAATTGGIDPATGVTVVHRDLVDASRATPVIGTDAGAAQRTLATTIYLPAATAPAPLIVLAHGFDGTPEKFSDLASTWAAAGFVVVVPRFPVTAGDAAVVDPALFGERLGDLAEQSNDVTFVLDQVLAENAATGTELSGRADPDRIGMFGLSLGSLTMWGAIAGPNPSEARIDAAIQSDGAPPGEPWDGPLLIAHSDVDPVFPYADIRAGYESASEPAYLLTLFGAAHAAVGENTPTPADLAYQQATTTFWLKYLDVDPDAVFPTEIAVDGVTSFEHRP